MTARQMAKIAVMQKMAAAYKVPHKVIVNRSENPDTSIRLTGYIAQRLAGFCSLFTRMWADSRQVIIERGEVGGV